MYSRYEDAMVTQSQLLQMTRSEVGIRLLNAMAYTMDAQHAHGKRMQPHYQGRNSWLVGLQDTALSMAEPVYMSMDVWNIIDHARSSFDPEPVRINDAFTPHGFMLLPKAFLINDAEANDGDVVAVRAISWMTVMDEDDPNVGCFWISYYSSIEDDIALGRVTTDRDEAEARTKFTPEVVAKLRSMGGGFSLMHTFQWSFGDKPWDTEEAGKVWACKECHKLCTHMHNPECSHGVTPVLDSHCEEMFLEDARERGKAQVQLIQTIWRIAAQVRKFKERAPRGVWRDANRKGVEQKDVTVITLRRDRDAREFEPTGRELSVQFVVRGHWRNQPYKDGVRQIWIAPYIKGPEDAPFKESKRVWEFVR